MKIIDSVGGERTSSCRCMPTIIHSKCVRSKMFYLLTRFDDRSSVQCSVLSEFIYIEVHVSKSKENQLLLIMFVFFVFSSI